MNRRESYWVVRVTLVLVVVSALPYLITWAVMPEGAHFTGLVFNPQDGNSYIAKMRQGFEGDWLFHLAFTPEQSHGAYLFLFHLLLGHLARWTGLPLIMVYHAARMVGGAAMLLGLYRLTTWLSAEVGERRVMFALAALGSGLGWLAGLFGTMTADLWVQEAFLAYALLANAHFPLAIGLMVGIADCGLRIAGCGWRTENGESRLEGGEKRRWLWGLGMVLAAVALGVTVLGMIMKR